MLVVAFDVLQSQWMLQFGIHFDMISLITVSNVECRDSLGDSFNVL